jgi:hypothetical protein
MTLELFVILFLKQDQQLQQIVDKTIMEGDLDRDGKLSFEEFAQMVSNTVGDISFVSRLALSHFTLRTLWNRWRLKTFSDGFGANDIHIPSYPAVYVAHHSRLLHHYPFII